MEVNILKSFVTVAETRSISRAAALLNMTQSALSRQIARLETELGTRLFDR
jgi:LysR family transcriptional regulator, nitrogen assimilation regulatory protein